MLPILAAHHEDSNSDLNLNAGILSETVARLLSLIGVRKIYPKYCKQSLSFGQITLHI
jgi:hypothetical protein